MKNSKKKRPNFKERKKRFFSLKKNLKNPEKSKNFHFIEKLQILFKFKKSSLNLNSQRKKFKFKRKSKKIQKKIQMQTEEIYHKNQIIWAKVHGYPWWPAIVLYL